MRKSEEAKRIAGALCTQLESRGSAGITVTSRVIAGNRAGPKSLFQDRTGTFSSLCSDHWRFCLFSASSHLIRISRFQARASPAPKVVVGTQRIPCLANGTVFHAIVIIVTVIYHVQDTPVQML